MKKSSSIWQICDRLCSDIVRARDGKCRFCGNPGSGSHHIIGRGYDGTMFLPENRLWLCQPCHQNELGLQERCIEIIGQSEFDRLWGIANKVTQLHRADLVLIREKLKKERDEQEKTNG